MRHLEFLRIATCVKNSGNVNCFLTFIYPVNYPVWEMMK